MGVKGALLAAELTKEQAAAAAARSASAERVRQQSGFHVTKGVLSEEVDAKRAEVRAKREHSAELQNMIESHKELKREQAEESKQRVLALEAQSRQLRQQDFDKKHFDAQLVREANSCVNQVASDVRQNTARRRRALRDTVVADRLADAPPPEVSAGAGGVARSRRASTAAAYVARGSQLPSPASNAKEVPPSPALGEPNSLASRKAAGYIFDPGPTGLTLQETQAGVIVGEVAAPSSANTLNVPVGGLVLAVNSLPVSGLSKIGVQKAIAKANWPMTLLVSPCFEHSFEGKGPIGLALQDTQNGVIIRDVAPDSPSAKQGLPVGGLIVAVNSSSASGLSKASLGPKLKERPLRLQIVPRDVAYLFRPRGPYHRGATSPR